MNRAAPAKRRRTKIPNQRLKQVLCVCVCVHTRANGSRLKTIVRYCSGFSEKTKPAASVSNSTTTTTSTTVSPPTSPTNQVTSPTSPTKKVRFRWQRNQHNPTPIQSQHSRKNMTNRSNYQNWFKMESTSAALPVNLVRWLCVAQSAHTW